MRFKRITVGSIIQIEDKEYFVEAVYPYFIVVSDLKTKFKDTFSFGDLVIAGLENGADV